MLLYPHFKRIIGGYGQNLVSCLQRQIVRHLELEEEAINQKKNAQNCTKEGLNEKVGVKYIR